MSGRSASYQCAAVCGGAPFCDAHSMRLPRNRELPRGRCTPDSKSAGRNDLSSAVDGAHALLSGGSLSLTFPHNAGALYVCQAST